MAANVRVQDLILKQSFEEVNKAIAPKRKSAPPKCEYEVELANGDVVVVRRKTARTNQLLVVIPSQDNMCYIKNESDGGTVEPLNEENLQKFLKDIPEGGLEVVTKDGDRANWISTIHREAPWREAFLGVLRDPVKRELIKNDMFLFDGEKTCRSVPYLLDHFREAKIIFNEMAKYIPRDALKIGNRNPESLPVLDALFGSRSYHGDKNMIAFNLLNDRWGIDGVKQFVDMYCQTPIRNFPSYSTWEALFYRRLTRYAVPNRTNETVFELGNMVDYMFCECTKQGFANDPGGFWSLWADYLDQQQRLYGEVRDKYSEALASDEKVTSYRVQLLDKEIDKEKFDKAVEKLSTYEYVGSRYRIIAPKSNDDLVEEGRQMSHCVGTYGNRVANGECMIFFMRSNSSPTKSLVTIEVRRDGSLGQVRARFNRKPASEHMAFVEQWYDKFFGMGIARVS